TLLLLPLIIHLVLRSRKEGTVWPLLLVPALVALGSNLHVGILLAPPILALGACATFAWDRWLPGREGMADSGREGRRFAGRLLLVAIAAGLAASLNPYGFRLAGVPFRLAGLLASLPSPDLAWSRPAPRCIPLFHISPP